jgi:hypothetical protein
MRGLKPTMQHKIGVQLLFTLFKARNIELKVEMLMKERVGNNIRFYRYDLSRRQYNKTSRFDLTDKGNAVQPSRLTLIRPDTIRPDKILKKQVEINKLNNLYKMLMIDKLFIYGQPGHHSNYYREDKNWLI